CTRISSAVLPPLSLPDALPILDPSVEQLLVHERERTECRHLGQERDIRGHVLPDQARAGHGLSTHDSEARVAEVEPPGEGCHPTDRKSTRLNSSHDSISYAVIC